MTRPKIIFNMLEGFDPIKNILGVGDPNVHKIDDQWWMFLGGFQTNFKNNLFCASLPKGESLNSNAQWRLQAQPDNPKRAQPLVPQPLKGSWDYGLHEPCFVEGKNKDGSVCRRIYYTGRSSTKTVGKGTLFSIGYLEKDGDVWRHHDQPIIRGNKRNPSVLGPKVIYDAGKWKMWYRATPNEEVKGEQPKVEIYYTESDNGVDGWSKPNLFFAREDTIAHAYVLKTNSGYEMLASISPNLYGEEPFPSQKLLLLSSPYASGNRADWSVPKEILAAKDGEVWYANGFFGSSICEANAKGEEGERYVFSRVCASRSIG